MGRHTENLGFKIFRHAATTFSSGWSLSRFPEGLESVRDVISTFFCFFLKYYDRIGMNYVPKQARTWGQKWSPWTGEKSGNLLFFGHLGWAQGIGLLDMRTRPHPPTSMLPGASFVWPPEHYGLRGCRTVEGPNGSKSLFADPETNVVWARVTKICYPKILKLPRSTWPNNIDLGGWKGGNTNVNDWSSTGHVTSWAGVQAWLPYHFTSSASHRSLQTL